MPHGSFGGVATTIKRNTGLEDHRRRGFCWLFPEGRESQENIPQECPDYVRKLSVIFLSLTFFFHYLHLKRIGTQMTIFSVISITAFFPPPPFLDIELIFFILKR